MTMIKNSHALAATLAEGTRVRLLHDTDRYPHFIARKGAVGVVVELDGDLVAVRFDANDIDGDASEWDNEVHWYHEDIDTLADDIEVAS